MELRDFRTASGQSRPPRRRSRRRQDAVAAALAEALDVDKADVEAALEDIRADVEAEIEDRLADAPCRGARRPGQRPDAAVDDGTLTEADKESVLKAYDEGIIGGPGGHVGWRWAVRLDGPWVDPLLWKNVGVRDEQPSTNS